MAAPTKSLYVVKPNNGEPFTVEADRYEHDDQTGIHKLYLGAELVATLLNVSVMKNPQPLASATPAS